ncbi:antitoxin [Caulobacter hibisci]|uniref:Antitoxin n=1 Tax=Caulobacter hibisci TaxID=2035993 RepID=A0ABS0SSF9_9CAUL|nr:antitoxin [Caulobacter hibisci]MBI1682111.1 antitoxin [Caulobacter hibisci]
MADGFDIHIDEERAFRLGPMAATLDMSVVDYVMSLIDRDIAASPFREIDPDPAIDEAIANAVEAGEEEAIPWAVLRDRLLARQRSADR